MKPDENQRTQARSTESAWPRPAISAYPNGRLVVLSDDFHLRTRFLEDSTGRLRPYSVEVVNFSEDEPVTPSVLATAPLTLAEAAANVPKMAAVLRMSEAAWRKANAEQPQSVSAIIGPRRKVVVPAEGTYLAEFWESVADAYHAAVVLEGARDPAARIAKQAGVRVATVRAWIARCRDQGLIAPGMQGRVG